MKTTIETLDGKQYTLVLLVPKEEVERVSFATAPCGTLYGITPYGYTVQVIALPALPRYPKPEDVRLLYRYMAEGINLIVADDNRTEIGIFDGFTFTGNVSYRDEQTGDLSWLTRTQHPEIIEATTETGERVDVAIEGDV